ncbi:MAG TPA: hypothetical protein VFO00_05155 [Vitreimonas sp.]|nr:hypothetical protein [Vitreimonas sp.]
MLRACMAALLVAASGIVSAPPAVAQSTYLDPVTGRDCVQPQRFETENYSNGNTAYYWYFTNTCGRTFSIYYYPQFIDPSQPPQASSTGVSPGSQTQPSQTRAVCTSNNGSRSCSGFTGEYEVR